MNWAGEGGTGRGDVTDAGSWQKPRLSAACSRRDKSETWLIGVCHWNSAKSPLTERKREGKKNLLYYCQALWMVRAWHSWVYTKGRMFTPFTALRQKEKTQTQIPHITIIVTFAGTLKSSDRLLFLFHYASMPVPSSCFVPLPGQSPGRVSAEDVHCAKTSLGQTRSIHAGVLSALVWLWNIRFGTVCLHAFSWTDIIHATHWVSGKLWLVRHKVGPLPHWFDQQASFSTFYGRLYMRQHFRFSAVFEELEQRVSNPLDLNSL